MGYNLLWYLPISLFIGIEFIAANVTAAFRNISTITRHFSSILLFSPSAYLFIGATVLSVLLPAGMLLLVPSFFDKEQPGYHGRYRASAGIVFAILVSIVAINFILWGSFPLQVDSESWVHVRMIPFLPWPNSPFFPKS